MIVTKIIGLLLITAGLIVTAVRIGVIFGARNPSLRGLVMGKCNFRFFYNYSRRRLFRKFSLFGLLAGISTAIILALARYYWYGNLNVDFSDIFGNIGWGSIAYIIRLQLLAIIEDIYSLLEVPTIDIPVSKNANSDFKFKRTLNMNSQPNSGQGSTYDQGSTSGQGSAEDELNKDIDYNQRLIILAKKALEALKTHPQNWSPDHTQAAEIYSNINKFNEKFISDYLKMYNERLKEQLSLKNTNSTQSAGIKRDREQDYTDNISHKYIKGDNSNDK